MDFSIHVLTNQFYANYNNMETALSKVNFLGFKVEEPLVLESGDTLRDLRIRYTTIGELNETKSNVVWVFHALTANSDPSEWWKDQIGINRFINPEQDFIVCANMPGSCYGSTKPESFDFPTLTIGDLVRSFQQLKAHLGIDKIKLGIGGSMGGQVLLQWAVDEPDLFETIVPIATNARHSAWGIAFNEAQRMALIQPDLENGLKAARAIALLSYRHYDTFDKTQSDDDGRVEQFSAASYQRYQGEKLVKRFSPYSYYTLSKAMDSHNIGRYYDGDLKKALSRIKSNAIIIGVDSDILFPPQEQAFIAAQIQNSSFHTIESLYGHDGFLLETEQIDNILTKELS
ncbi:homoserine O-acetyltransferase [Ekhidna lutea]|uniref:Homoserine O-acetyltransferase n=1 Tax=Ekhidna lutea TaxID=447679 RepID=A0A239KQX4_EKHLU|nr:homoserine O-acetyltransferase [Ekhidna lutea]SNT20797.1 homoserine O-acetyltransferase [Ekhidna lutea]